MLAQLVEPSGRPTVSFAAGFSSLEMLDLLKPNSDDIFCISAIPPLAFSHARALNQQLRAKFPQTRIVIGVWGFTGEMDRALRRFQPSFPDKFVCSLTEALEYLGVPGPASVVDEDLVLRA